jgi:hypothetical protein
MTKQIGNNIVDTETGEIVGKPINEKQRYVIEIIESNLNISFEGNTYQDAWKFINANMEASKAATAKAKSMVNEVRKPRHDNSLGNIGHLYNCSGYSSLVSYFKHIENKYCDLFSDEDIEGSFMPTLDGYWDREEDEHYI